MTESNDKELWDRIDAMRLKLRDLWEQTNVAYNRMRDEEDEAVKQELAKEYRAAIEKANEMEQEICNVMDSFNTGAPLPPVEME